MKSHINLLLVFIIYSSSEIVSSLNQQCVCVSYDDCNYNYTLKGNVSEYHETRVYDDSRPRPSCESPVDVCCNVSGNSFPTSTNAPNIEPETEKPSTKKWSCGYGIRGDSANSTGKSVNALYGEFPWMTAIMKRIKFHGDDSAYHCGGSLINERVVLTSASEVYKLQPSDLTVRVGQYNWKSPNEPHQDIKVDSIRIHPQFKAESYINNYALLILSEPAKSSVNVNTICMAESKDDYDQSKCLETGWGKNHFIIKHGETVLRKSMLYVLQNKVCENIYQMVYAKDKYKLHNSVFCAGDDKLEYPCTGNGGSPLICPLKLSPNRYVQVGIASIGICKERYKPGLYADVSTAQPWINEVVESLGLSTDSYTP